ncbi:protein I'm not dead yet-like [Ctenocephalides felis]|uniref:protein I'm not dead yet-like n=1 Tax=Ctenocephalides felis TaxID=7515 RepID=UPI000E6E48E6|nr:protein I'm not dead yet-like [Ctenocephalides felis]
MSRVGCSHPKLHASFAAVTTFISMWITNTATTALMCPIVMAILVELENQGVSKVYINRIATGPDANLGKQDLPDDPIPTKLTVSYFLVIAFSSTVGGTSTIIGTGTNMMLKGAYETLYPDSDVSFVYWMILFLPPMIINAVLMELGLQFIFFGLWRKNSDAAKAIHIDEETRNSIKQVIKRKYADLGPITWHECMIISFFLLMILLFFIRHPDFMPGYVRLFNRHLNQREQALYIRDSAAVMLLFVIMFFIPKTLDVLNFFKKRPKTLPEGSEDPLVTWKFLAGRMPWGFILLLGSSYALAQGSLVSGMNDYLAEKLKHLAAVPLALLLLLVLIFIKILTEFISNVAVASITLPILNTMSQNLQVNPLYFMLPATIVASYCFLMPVGTPPNTILRTTYHIKPRQMLKGGLWTSFITLFITWTMFLFYSSLIYKDLLSFPRWAEIKDAENVEAFLLFVRNLIVQSRHSGGLRGEAFTINDIIYNETDYSLYALNWGDNLSFETSLS